MHNKNNNNNDQSSNNNNKRRHNKRRNKRNKNRNKQDGQQGSKSDKFADKKTEKVEIIEKIDTAVNENLQDSGHKEEADIATRELLSNKSMQQEAPDDTDDLPIIGITMGDLNSISPEIVIKALLDKRILKYCIPVIYGSSRVLSYHKKVLSIEGFNYHVASSIDRIKPKTVNVINCWTEETQINLGQADKNTGHLVLRTLESVAYDIQNEKIDAIVTAPINKHVVNSHENPFKGHTEFFTQKFNIDQSLMFMVSDYLKVGLLTNHLALKEVAAAITPELMERKLSIMEQSLIQDFGIEKPKIAVLGLNPHAGDNGTIGFEEMDFMQPTIERLRERGMMVFGPYAADGYFGSNLSKGFDAVMASYHDQGLIPFKAISFGEGINFTAGLPIVRTSPDHGTAYDIAGKNKASGSSMLQAIFMAIDILRQRELYEELMENQLGQPKLKVKKSISDADGIV